MYNADDSMRTTSKRVEMQDVLGALHDAIASLPQRKDSRSDPIFEPHFKVLSVVHKLVQKGDMSVRSPHILVYAVSFSLPCISPWQQLKLLWQRLGLGKRIFLLIQRDGSHMFLRLFENSRVPTSRIGIIE